MPGDASLTADGQDPRDQKTYYLRITPFRRVVIPLLKYSFRIVSSLKIQGAGNLPHTGPVILVSNHLTTHDPFFLQFALTRPVFFMGKEELFRTGGLDWMLRQLGGFPVYRGAQDEWAMRHAAKVLQLGQVLGMFPEGTRSKGSGLKPAKTGFARLAQNADCPVVPAALHGLQYLFRRFPRRTSIQLSFGEPVYPEKGESLLELTDRLMFALADLLPPEARGAYRNRPDGF